MLNVHEKKHPKEISIQLPGGRNLKLNTQNKPKSSSSPQSNNSKSKIQNSK